MKIERENRVLMNSMAAADIGVMVLYFSMLNALKHLSSKISTATTQKAMTVTQDVIVATKDQDTVR